MKLANDINEWLDFTRVMKFVKFGNLIWCLFTMKGVFHSLLKSIS